MIGVHRKTIVALGVLLCSLCSSLGTQIFCIYNDNAIYFASDSLATRNESNRLTLQKIFRVADTCCVGIAGFYGNTLTETDLRDNSKKITDFNFPQDLGNICSNLYSSEFSLPVKITNIVTEFSAKYNYARKKMLQYGAKPPIATYLYFVGYDRSETNFFGSWCIFNSTNHTESLEPVFSDILKRDGGHLSHVGERTFFYKLAENPTNFSFPNAMALSVNLKSIISGKPLPQETISETLLEMFRLHKEYAAPLKYDVGLIDEPYIIYRITREKTAQIH